MEKLQTIGTNAAFTLAIVVLTAAPLLIMLPGHMAQAHLLGTVKQVDNYQVSFQQTPQFSSAGEKTTMHFAVLQDNAVANNVNVAVQIQDKESGKVVEQMPYTLHEISDITVPYTFQNNADYIVKLMMRMEDGNPEHMAKPLTADFDVSIKPTSVISPMELLAGAVPFTAGLIGAVVFVFKKVQ